MCAYITLQPQRNLGPAPGFSINYFLFYLSFKLKFPSFLKFLIHVSVFGCIANEYACANPTTAEYLCLLIKMLGSVFLSVNDMITEIRDQGNLPLVETERQESKKTGCAKVKILSNTVHINPLFID